MRGLGKIQRKAQRASRGEVAIVIANDIQIRRSLNDLGARACPETWQGLLSLQSEARESSALGVWRASSVYASTPPPAKIVRTTMTFQRLPDV